MSLAMENATRLCTQAVKTPVVITRLNGEEEKAWGFVLERTSYGKSLPLTALVDEVLVHPDSCTRVVVDSIEYTATGYIILATEITDEEVYKREYLGEWSE